jgi:hypothetical protein
VIRGSTDGLVDGGLSCTQAMAGVGGDSWQVYASFGIESGGDLSQLEATEELALEGGIQG